MRFDDKSLRGEPCDLSEAEEWIPEMIEYAAKQDDVKDPNTLWRKVWKVNIHYLE
jgi:hypothetical protein